ncbi:MAG TPA: DUF3971 domain-containing protein [Synergistaceae bacterium]|nr:DUF3971 domain-containing protein [Synergistaceae bacterium]HQF90828.1 DUF3971 domain-containing protein [Synergistaceae bacterium]HQH77968.1 DUF3971 domain-containing protein [Synergistaceae bacterium]HQK24082.1 DUF3971 domain-containing protein [Synergistaceae bacterium]
MARKKVVGLVIGALLAVVVGGVFFVDGATDLVKDQAQSAVRDSLGGELLLGDVTGNPLRGYTVTRVALEKDGVTLFEADRISLAVSLLAFLRGGAIISDVEIAGARGDADRLGRFFATIKGEGGGGSSLVGRVTFSDSVLTTPAGTLLASRARISLGGSTVALELDGRWQGPGKTPLSLSGKGTLAFQGDALAVAELDLRVGQGKVLLQGSVLPELGLWGTVEGLEGSEVGALWPETEGALRGRLSLAIQSGGTWKNPRISGDATLEGGKFSGVTVDRASGRFSFTPALLKVAGIEASVFGASLRGTLALGLRNLPPTVALQMRGAKGDLAQVAQAFPALGDLQGMVEKISLDLKGSGSALEGRMTLVAPSLSGRGHKLEQVAADVKLRDGKTFHVAARAQGFGSPLTLSGTASWGKKIDMNLEFKATRLDLARLEALFPELRELKPRGEASVAVTLKGDPGAPQISGIVSAPQIILAGETLSKPVVKFALRGNTLAVNAASLTWKGGVFSASGSVGGLGGKGVTLDLKGKGEALALENLAGAFPALKGSGVKGTGTLSWKASGSPEKILVEAALSWKSLRALDQLGVSDLEIRGSGRVTGGKPALEGPLTLRAARLAWAGAGVDRPTLALRAEGNRLVVERGEGRIAGGSLALSGTAKLPERAGEEGALDFKGSIRDLGLGALGKDLGLPVALGGQGTVNFSLGGGLAAPRFALDATFPTVTVEGAALADASVSLEGTPGEIRLTSARGAVEGTPFSFSGMMRPGPQGYALDLKGSGEGLDLASLLRRVPALRDKGIQGKMNLRFFLKGTPGALEGSGELTSERVGFLGLSATGVKAPFSVQKNVLAAPAIKALFHGGDAALGLRMNLGTGGWELQAALAEVDLGATLRALSQASGTVGGTATVDFKGKGNAFKGEFSGKGLFQSREGAVTGYPWVNLVATLHGASGVRYQLLKAPFSVQGAQLTLQEGTKAVPWEGDPLYRSLEAQGTVGPEGKLNLAVKGVVNAQVLNALTGGVQGGLLEGIGGGASVKDILKGALKGFADGGAKQDFRAVSLKVGGRAASPKISDLQVESKAPGQGDGASPSPEKPAPAPEKTISLPGGIEVPLPDGILPEGPKPSPEEGQAPVEAEPTAAPNLEDAIKDAVLDTLFK